MIKIVAHAATTLTPAPEVPRPSHNTPSCKYRLAIIISIGYTKCLSLLVDIKSETAQYKNYAAINVDTTSFLNLLSVYMCTTVKLI